MVTEAEHFIVSGYAGSSVCKLRATRVAEQAQKNVAVHHITSARERFLCINKELRRCRSLTFDRKDVIYH